MSIGNNQTSQQDREFIRATLILGALAFASAAAVYFATISWVAPIPRDSTTLVVGRDFLDFWTNGRAAWATDPGRLYDPHTLARAIASLLGPNYLGQTWAYPPGFLLLAAPFGRLPYLSALLCWTACGLCLFAWLAFHRIADRNAALAVIVSPAAMLCLMSGQASFLLASLFLAIFALLDRKPLVAGFLIGLLSLKPQLGVLFPVMLIASARWRTFLAATGTTLLIAVVTATIWGPGIWLDYVKLGIPTGNLVLSDPKMIVAPFMPTVFMNLRAAGLGYGHAMIVQEAVAVAAAAALLWAIRARTQADGATLFALFLSCTLCTVPYTLSYDTLPLTAASMALVASGRLDALGRRLVQFVYWLPLIQIGLGLWHLPGPALIPLSLGAYILVRLARDQSREAESPGVALRAS